MPKRVEFYYDIGSSYSYLAATQLDALVAATGAEVVWRPFLLGGVFKATGNQPPVLLPAKGSYLVVDMARWARRYGVPLRLPSQFPRNTMRAMRALTYATGKGRGAPLAHALFRAFWVDDLDVSADGPLGDAARAVGLDPQQVLAACETPEVKLALRETTEEAVRRGAFGAPTFFVGDEMFWGNDRLDFVAQALR